MLHDRQDPAVEHDSAFVSGGTVGSAARAGIGAATPPASTESRVSEGEESSITGSARCELTSRPTTTATASVLTQGPSPLRTWYGWTVIGWVE